MQTGVEIHLHQGKPRACREHAPHRPGVPSVADHPESRLLERLFERGPTYTSGPTVRQANVRRRTHKPSTTRRGAAEARLAGGLDLLQVPEIALRRTEEDRAEALSPPRVTTAAVTKRDAQAGHRRTAPVSCFPGLFTFQAQPRTSQRSLGRHTTRYASLVGLACGRRASPCDDRHAPERRQPQRNSGDTTLVSCP
jgi:hypothetical protein